MLSSELPGLNEGALIASDEPIHLPQGSGLTLMAEDGAVIKLVGPYYGVPAPAQQREGERSLLTAIAGLMTGPQEKSSTATGVIRSPGADDQPASPWLIDTSHVAMFVFGRGSRPLCGAAMKTGRPPSRSRPIEAAQARLSNGHKAPPTSIGHVACLSKTAPVTG